MGDPVSGTHLAYAVHFYAGSASYAPSGHGVGLRQKAVAALANGVPLFASEWGACEYTGDGNLDLNAAREWLDFLTTHRISDANWAISDKAESCAALQPGSSGLGEWTPTQLTVSGAFVRDSIRSATSTVTSTASSTVIESSTPWTTATPPPTLVTTPVQGVCAQEWGQCGGTGWSGPSCCMVGSGCVVINPWYHQCLAGAPSPTPSPTLPPSTPTPETSPSTFTSTTITLGPTPGSTTSS